MKLISWYLPAVLLVISPAWARADKLESLLELLSERKTHFSDRIAAIDSIVHAAELDTLPTLFNELDRPVPNPWLDRVQRNHQTGEVEKFDLLELEKRNLPTTRTIQPLLPSYAATHLMHFHVNSDEPTLDIDRSHRLIDIRSTWHPAFQISSLRVDLFAKSAEAIAKQADIAQTLLELLPQVNTEIEAFAWLEASQHALNPLLDSAVASFIMRPEQSLRLKKAAVQQAIDRLVSIQRLGDNQKLTRRQQIFIDEFLSARFNHRGWDLAIGPDRNVPDAMQSDPRYLVLFMEGYWRKRQAGEDETARWYAQMLDRALEEPLSPVSDVLPHPYHEISNELRQQYLTDVDAWITQHQPELEAAAAALMKSSEPQADRNETE